MCYFTKKFLSVRIKYENSRDTQLQLRKFRRHDMSPLCFKMHKSAAFQFFDVML